MCGRFVQAIDGDDWKALTEALGVAEASPPPERRFNVAPSQAMRGVRTRREDGVVVPHAFRFGLRGPKDHLVINARAETASERPMFRHLLPKGRVLIAASAFYEWAPKTDAVPHKTPCCFARADGKPFWFAALARTDGDATGCVLMTTNANELLSRVHPRMPVMLDEKQARLWLSNEVAPAQALDVLVPYAQPMRAWAVGLGVNNPRFEEAACIAPQGELPA